MMSCIFCAIAAGEVPSTKVHEDADVIAFLDIRPLARGHTLVVPKAHVQKLEETDGTTASALIEVTKALTPRLCQTVGASDATIAINDGPDAGQEVPHLHIHIVPRQAGDGAGPIHALFGERPTPDMDDLQTIAEALA